jgi:hypothetical protein
MLEAVVNPNGMGFFIACFDKMARLLNAFATGGPAYCMNAHHAKVHGGLGLW